jgi:hypothetical protein
MTAASLCALSAAWFASPSFAESLPVFKIAPDPAAENAAMQMYGELFGSGKRAIDSLTRGAAVAKPNIAVDASKLPSVSELKPVQTETAVKLDRNKRLVEVDRRSGHWFLADMNSLWNPLAKPSLPDAEKAQSIASDFAERFKLLPRDQFVSAKLGSITETAAIADAPGAVKSVLDRQVNYEFQVNVDGRSIPVVGGGGQIKISVGDQGRIIGVMGGWRPINGVIEKAEIIPAERVIDEFRRANAGMKLDGLKASLAYYAAPAFEAQAALAPVWVISGMTEIAGKPAPIRKQIVAATAQYGPVYPKAEKLAPRAIKPIDQLKRYVPKKGDEESRGASLLDVIIPPAYAQEGGECGTSWIGVSQGLGGSQGNKQGFVNHCRAQGWAVNFDWGDGNAFERDWRADDDSYVDAADLVFYTGHANSWGWNLANPDDGSMSNGEVGGASDIYGQQDLEWVIIAACGPHQSNHFVGSIDNAFDRWRTIFDGLHSFLGYGAVTFDNTSEGGRFMELARSGWGVVDAWFRTAQEIQPATNGEAAPDGNTVFVTVMYAHNGDHCARNEKIHGVGPTCGDVRGAGQQRHLIWSGT